MSRDILAASKVVPEADYESLDNGGGKVYVFGKDRITRDVLSKYERVSIVGFRIDQIQRGAPVSSEILAKVEDPNDYKGIVILELESHKCPVVLLRHMPDGKKIEVWKLSELKL